MSFEQFFRQPRSGFGELDRDRDQIVDFMHDMEPFRVTDLRRVSTASLPPIRNTTAKIASSRMITAEARTPAQVSSWPSVSWHEWQVLLIPLQYPSEHMAQSAENSRKIDCKTTHYTLSREM